MWHTLATYQVEVCSLFFSHGIIMYTHGSHPVRAEPAVLK